ncbi:MAG: hypothetical protein RLZZ86_271 [Cyanobacteriota bacterium]|jgi:hypothetical protein
MKIKIVEHKVESCPQGGIWDAYIDGKIVACRAFVNQEDKFKSLKEVIEKAKNKIQLEVETFVNETQLDQI